MYFYSRLLMLCVFTVLGFTWGLSSLEARPTAGHHEEHHEMQHGERRGEHPGNHHHENEHRDNRGNWDHRGVGSVGGLGRDQGGAVIIDDNGNGNNNDNGDNGDNPNVDQEQADQLYNSYNPANK